MIFIFRLLIVLWRKVTNFATVMGKNTGNDWKDRLGVMYSTNPDFNYQTDEEPEQELLPPQQQKLRLRMEKNGRGGKTVTVISGFIGPQADMEALARTLKTFCGCGGSAKDGEIIIQGDFREKLKTKLLSLGYTQTKG
jgi:translation initiation factor 1